MNASALLSSIRENRPLSPSMQRRLIVLLSWPAILAQISLTAMQLIDAAMVGQLGTQASASIGLVSSTTWLIQGVCSGCIYGFSVQTAQAIGARDLDRARSLCRQGLKAVLVCGLLFGLGGALISFQVPLWLHGDESIVDSAATYLCLFCLALPFFLLNTWAVQMLQAAGDTRLPGLVQVLMCGLDIGFNALLIYGVHLGVAGAALGTGAATALAALFLVVWTLKKNPFLNRPASWSFSRRSLKQAFQIGLPVSVEQLITGSSYVAFTRIVSSLGTISIAANSFAITAESLCYMPAFGCSSAATAILGQCTGAGRSSLAQKISWRIARIGIGMMAVSGLALYLLALPLMGLLTPDGQVQQPGAAILKMEAFAEPMYGASIVINGILRGKGDTLWPACLNLVSIWCVRIPLAALFAGWWGLKGAWLAMGLELNIRGLLFLLRLKRTWKPAPSSFAKSDRPAFSK